MSPPGVGVQIVDHVAAPDDEHSFITQWRKPLRRFIVKFGWLCFVNTELHHRDICLGKDMSKHGPGAVIETPSHSDLRYCGRRRMGLMTFPLLESSRACSIWSSS